ncbi:hypothetical protein IWZ01DRAFT_108517 [Phyllosticta capitalensis]
MKAGTLSLFICSSSHIKLRPSVGMLRPSRWHIMTSRRPGCLPPHQLQTTHLRTWGPRGQTAQPNQPLAQHHRTSNSRLSAVVIVITSSSFTARSQTAHPPTTAASSQTATDRHSLTHSPHSSLWLGVDSRRQKRRRRHDGMKQAPATIAALRRRHGGRGAPDLVA